MMGTKTHSTFIHSVSCKEKRGDRGREGEVHTFLHELLKWCMFLEFTVKMPCSAAPAAAWWQSCNSLITQMKFMLQGSSATTAAQQKPYAAWTKATQSKASPGTSSSQCLFLIGKNWWQTSFSKIHIKDITACSSLWLCADFTCSWHRMRNTEPLKSGNLPTLFLDPVQWHFSATIRLFSRICHGNLFRCREMCESPHGKNPESVIPCCELTDAG